MSGAAVEMLGMSDEDFLQLNGPNDAGNGAQIETVDAGATTDSGATGSLPGSTEVLPPAADPASGEAGAASETGAAASTEAGTSEAAAGTETEPNIKPAQIQPPVTAAPADAPAGNKLADAAGAGDAGAEAKPETVVAAEPDYKAAYDLIMAPFKANGKELQLKDPAEAVQLMQMGAHYTRKMQELKPQQGMLAMLRNNGLLDEAKLSFLIDLDKGDPEAVKKFIKDRGIDPLDIDTSTDPAYRGGDHRVSDQQLNFETTLEELSSNPAGQGTLQTINAWDNASKEMLWQDPSIISAIHEQRESGVYALITGEMDRLQMLGKLPTTLSFLQAYEIVGKQLIEQATGGQSNAQGSTPVAPASAPQVLDTRVATPKSQVANNEAVAAASPSRGTPAQPQNSLTPTDILAMSDEDFMKLEPLKNRL